MAAEIADRPINEAGGGRLLPKKATYRQRAHCNPLSDSYIVYPPSPDCVDWSLHFPKFFPKLNDDDTSQNEVAAIGQTTATETRNDTKASTASQNPGLQLHLNTTDHPIAYSSSPIDNRLNGLDGPSVSILDAGCGFGGLMMCLSSLFPDKLIMGLEIREKVTTYVGEKIRALRIESDSMHNVSVIRSNAMKFLVNYFRKSQLEKIFFCFPDPHYKKSNWRRRIVGPSLLSLYAYVLKPGGKIYTVTDVPDTHEWMVESMRGHPLFEEVVINVEERERDPCIKAMEEETEEGKKVKRNGKPCFSSVFIRRSHSVLL